MSPTLDRVPSLSVENYEQIQALTDDDVIAEINRSASNVTPGVSFWYGELERRQVLRSMQNAERLTRLAVILTGANVVIALTATVAAILSLT